MLKYDCSSGGIALPPRLHRSIASGILVRVRQDGSTSTGLYVYVKTDLLVLAGNSEGEPSGGNSGLSSAFLRALAIVEQRHSSD